MTNKEKALYDFGYINDCVDELLLEIEDCNDFVPQWVVNMLEVIKGNIQMTKKEWEDLND